MLKLIKYELRKVIFPLMMILAVTGLAEAAYLYGIFGAHGGWVIGGGIFLLFALVFGVLILGFCGIAALHKDLNSKQSYMLFLLPKNSYEIMGAKMLECLVLVLFGAGLAGAIAYLDYRLAYAHFDQLKSTIEYINEVVSSGFGPQFSMFQIIMFIAELMESWVLMISLGFLAVTAVATVLNGRKHNGVIAVILYFILSWAVNKGLNAAAGLVEEELRLGFSIALSLIIAVLVFFICGFLMEKKLDV